MQMQFNEMLRAELDTAHSTAEQQIAFILTFTLSRFNVLEPRYIENASRWRNFGFTVICCSLSIPLPIFLLLLVSILSSLLVLPLPCMLRHPLFFRSLTNQLICRFEGYIVHSLGLVYLLPSDARRSEMREITNISQQMLHSQL
jgi:hypothetical protein